MSITWRYASVADSPRLAEWNHALIREEGHRNTMSVSQLTERMQAWLEHEYKAVIFCGLESEPIAYALFRAESALIYVRQFYVIPNKRRIGNGRRCVKILREEIWPRDTRLVVEVLCQNPAGIAFWRAVGFSDYSITLEIFPDNKPA